MKRENFLQDLFQFCEGSIEIRALPSRRREFFSIGDMAGIDQFCDRNREENIFFGVATRDGNGGTEENIVHFPALWCDVDFKETPREILADRWKQFPFSPSIIIKSGGGVHLYWPLKEPTVYQHRGEIREVNRRIAAQLGGDLNACDPARVMRMPGSLNHKYDHKPVVEITKMESNFHDLDEFLRVLPEIDEKPSNRDQVEPSDDWLRDAMRGVGKGQRNATGTKIAGYWINKLPPQDVLTILSSWNQRNDPPLSEKDIEDIVKSVSRYEPDKSEKRVDISHVYDAPRMLEEYRSHIKNMKANRFRTGIRQIDAIIRGVAGGEVLDIMGRAGTVKTGLLLNLLRNYVKNSAWKAVFFSLEMPVASVTERYHQILTGCTGQQVEEIFTSSVDGAEDQRRMLEADFLKEMKGVYTIPVKVDISDIAAYVRLIENHFREKVGVVGIDYLGLLDGKGTSQYEIVSRLARDIKSMAKLLNLPLIVLTQASRKGGAGEKEISLDHARDSGAIEEGADFMLGLWQQERPRSEAAEIVEPGNREYDLVCKILKNRKGPKNSRWILDLDPNNFRIGPDAREYETSQGKKNRGYDG